MSAGLTCVHCKGHFINRRKYGAHLRKGRCWAKTATKEATNPELLHANDSETLMPEKTIADGEVTKESMVGEVGGGRRRSTTKATETAGAAGFN